jgi:selenide,water dikinase
MVPFLADPHVLVGTETGDDAAVYQLSEDTALALTVDYFTPIVDDPYTFGQIAAANSLSDVYAMGGRPILMLSIVGFPRDMLPLEILGEILRGGAEKGHEAGVTIGGGHSVDDAEPKVGYVVLGLVHPARVWRNVGARPGDALILTKALGTGIVSNAIREGKATDAAVAASTRSMTTLNRAAAEAARHITIDAATDITGFGLIGHLRGMVRGSKVRARISASSLRAFPDVPGFAASGLVPGGTRRNLRSAQKIVQWAPDVSDVARAIIGDAQTSGGLLFATRDGEALLAALEDAGVTDAHKVGEIVASDPEGSIEVVA